MMRWYSQVFPKLGAQGQLALSDLSFEAGWFPLCCMTPSSCLWGAGLWLTSKLFHSPALDLHQLLYHSDGQWRRPSSAPRDSTSDKWGFLVGCDRMIGFWNMSIVHIWNYVKTIIQICYFLFLNPSVYSVYTTCFVMQMIMIQWICKLVCGII